MYVVEKDFHGSTFSYETGRVAKQASGSVLVKQGDSIVLVTACMGDARDGDFLPLTIDYVEKSYAAGKIPGGFFKREGKLSERETLTSRLIDRPCRPLFPEGFNREIQVVATVISADSGNDTDVMAVCGASAALTLSELPFEGPIAAVRVVRIGGKLLINPSVAQLKDAELNFIVAGTKDAIVMVEGGAEEVPEQEVLDALFYAHKELQVLIDMQLELQSKAGKQKIEVEPRETHDDLRSQIEKVVGGKLKEAVQITDKHARRDSIKDIRESVVAELVSADLAEADAAEKTATIKTIMEDVLYDTVRGLAFKDSKRIDGRRFDEVRDISIEVGLLPRTHGSALFTRGETQAIVVATLGTDEEAQRLDNLNADAETSKRFMLHYNFPPFSVGETRPMRGPGRREIGHGALAERAVKAVLPTDASFPYVIRIVSEITESNGSSSMASVCGASLALMDAGVKTKAPVAGVAMGLMKDGDDFVILTDILGDEDHLGDMDFKVCGTQAGITALQMDIKIKGLDQAIMSKAMEQARAGRLHILSKMDEVLGKARPEISELAPRIETIKINPERIKDVIGPGGKTIRSISESCSVKIDISDAGIVSVAGTDKSKVEAALNIIRSHTREGEVGELYKGIVKKIKDFGAFVEVFPGKDGLLHISDIADERIDRVTDVLREGQEVWVKIIGKDNMGKLKLSRREAMIDMEKAAS